MNKILVAILATASTLVLLTPAQAVSPQTTNFDVNINLTTGCVISAAPLAVAFTYTAFQTSAAALDGTSNTFGVSCTKNLSYAMVLDNTGTVTDTATDLIYSLTVPAGTKTGDGLQQVYSITGSMAAGQSGKCATSLASCTNAGTGGNKTRTLTVAY